MSKRGIAFVQSLTLAAIALSGFCCAPAQAFWGYSPWTGQSNWLWMARGLQYPLNRFSSYNAPYYLASPLINSASYAVSRGFNRGPSAATNQQLLNSPQFATSGTLNGAQRHVYYGDYQPGETVYDARPLLKPYTADPTQMGYTGPQNAAVGAPNGAPLIASAANGPPIQTPYAPGFSPPMASRNAFSPMATGFIDVVNQQYNGDLSKALFDPATRSYAKAVGLISSDDLFDTNFTPEKIELIRKVLADDREDAATRLTTVRMLIKH